MTSIKDIASLAGVSTATVSRFLNGHITVREETQRRIEDAVRMLDYRPHYLARSLVLKETQTIGAVIPDILNPYFSELARGVEDEAVRTGWSMVLCNSDNKVDKELSYLQMLQYRRVDGIVLVSSGQSKESLQALMDGGVHVALAARRVDGVKTDSVTIQNTRGAYEATRYLIGLGHRRIAMIGGISQVVSSRERLEGYRMGLAEAGIPVEKGLILEGGLQIQGGYSAMKRLLRRSPRPTAVFAANDLMAIGAINAIQTEGAVVPDDISVVGFDGISLGDVIKPRLTTVSVAPYRIGRTACRLLLDRVARKRNPAPRMLTVEPSLVIRESCSPPPDAAVGEDGLVAVESGKTLGKVGLRDRVRV